MKKIYIFNNKSKNNNEKGMALIATLIFVFVLGSMGIAMLTMASNDSKLSTLQRESNRAFYLAETGIEEALWFMNFSPNNQEGLNWRVPKYDADGKPTKNPWPSPEDRDSETEYYQVYITDEPITGAERIKFESTGIVNNSGEYSDGQRTIEVILEKGTIQNNSLSYNYAMLGDTIVQIHGAIDVNGDIHSNGDINISGAAFDLTNGTLSATGDINAHMDGITQPAQPIPLVDFNYYYNKALQDGVFYGEDTDVSLDSDQVIEGYHYIDGNLIIKPPAKEIIIRDGAIFVTGTIEFQGNPDIIIEKSDDWNNPLSLVSQGDIFGRGNVHGEGIIQSESTIRIVGNVDINVGALVANTIDVRGNVDIIYDKGLQEEIVVGTGIEVWKKVSWQEK